MLIGDNMPDCLIGLFFFQSSHFYSVEFDLTANSLGAHIETHGKLILRTLTYFTVNSQDDSHCDLAVNFP